MGATCEIAERELEAPVFALFPTSEFHCYEQVPLGRKRIDLVFVHRRDGHAVSVELKVSDWKHALWQAAVNSQVSDLSYVAVWHEYVHRATKHADLFDSYGVGIIAVERHTAQIISPSATRSRRISPALKADWYRHLLKAPGKD